MPRAAACTLLVALFVSASLAAPRGAGSSHTGGGASVSHSGGASVSHSGSAGSRGFRGSISSRPFPRHHHRGGSYFYPYLFPYDEPYGYDEPEAPPRPPAPTYVQAPPPQLPAQPKLIEVPAAANAAPAKPLPPAIFILTSGERLETSRFLLRASDLSVMVGRQQRTIPITKLDLDATLAANRERGIDLEIPADPNQISLRF